MIRFLMNLFNLKKKNEHPRYLIEREQIDDCSKIVKITADRHLTKTEILEILKNEIGADIDE